MKQPFIIRWDAALDALRSAGWALLIAGAVLGFLADSADSDAMHTWAKGAIMAGAGLWSAWALLKPSQAVPPSQQQQM
ncbi:hypothetical protein B9Z51_10875 [Limnohabitans sp. T6-5]|uniref:hypothetical protein n=1 Tax=Limnohabitans sp. T6-5 TaxID=1100724 RepID=UPI000D36FD09|nr:hypothetical protein [Limnohabitans sp. T6-5]PUE09374.1 hypothetical protein B9Z51_10875 [Limnohabitans sp. T6-5]